MPRAKHELFKSADVCELTGLQAYMLRSWEAEFPSLGKPAPGGAGRVYKRSDVELVLRIKRLVFDEGLTLAGARRRLDEEQEAGVSAVAVAVDDMLSEAARTRLREVRRGLEAILQMLGPALPRPAELTLVAPDSRTKGAAGKRRSSARLRAS
jgi:DNA-binding transcriptional MerR regulator